MHDFWSQHIQRADQLAQQPSGSSELLSFYAQLLRAQKVVYEQLTHTTGDLQTDLPLLKTTSRQLLETVRTYGPSSLSNDASDLLTADAEVIDHMLLDYWTTPSDTQFFAKAILQPYNRALLDSGKELIHTRTASERTCNRCGGRPQVSYLETKESTGSGNRDLVCATCLSSWEFRRVVCANCGEERPAKLGYFHSPEFEHVRLEACDTCKHYLKSVDRTQTRLAVPLVDEIYASPLDLWAQKHGYTKIELNLVGL